MPHPPFTGDYAAILKKYWGHDTFRPLQLETIESVAAGRDTLVLTPSGGGKSVIYQVPALASEGVCVVITPLISLMKDQVDRLRSRRILAEAIHGGRGRQEIDRVLDNCIYGDVYNGPRLWQDGQTPTEWLLQNFDASYKVILVGDAAMNPYELREKQYDWRNQRYGPSGLEWLELFKKHFPYLIWLNPEPLPAFQDFWTLTHLQLAKMFPMFDLSAEGLEAGMKRLMVKR